MYNLKPCLWFDHQAEEAANLYVSIFSNSRLGQISRYGDSGSAVSGQTKGMVMTVTFEIGGQKFMALNGGPLFAFSPAISFFVHCESEKEIDTLWERLSEGGTVFMSLDKYPFSEKYGWVQDRFGLSWQLILSKSKQKIAPSFLFVKDQFGKAEEAMNFYISQFENSRIETIERYGPHDSGPEGTVKYAKFTLAGQEYVVMDGPGDHQFTFSPAISLVVSCDTQEEVDNFWEKLSEDGRKGQCGWLEDKYGVSWQIVPSEIADLVGGGTAEQTERVMSALLKMTKLDIAGLKEAFART